MAAAKDTTKETAKPESVTITLPLTREKQDDQVVILNGVSYLIKRGEEVTIPYPVYEVLKHSEKMDMLALKRSQDLSKGKMS